MQMVLVKLSDEQHFFPNDRPMTHRYPLSRSTTQDQYYCSLRHR